MIQFKAKYVRGLFPSYFKIIGIAVIVMTIAVSLFIRSYIIIQPKDQKELIKLIIMNIIILGVFFIAWSRDKIEDEMTVHLRFLSMGFAFIWGVFYALFFPLANLLFDEMPVAIPSQQLILSMLLVFIVIYTIQKRKN